MNEEQTVDDNLEDWRRRISSVVAVGLSPSVVHCDNFNAFVFTNHADDLGGIQRWVEALGGDWVYRGQRDEAWALETAIDRASKRWVKLPTHDGRENPGHMLLNPSGNEKNMLEEFRRRAHHFLSSTPADHEILDWLTLMQHYGAPTRMLDWSHSPYVAGYFAIEKLALEHSRGHAIWAISLEWLRTRSNEDLSRVDDFFATGSAWADARKRASRINALLQADMENVFARTPDVVTAASSFRVNERQAAQQGVSLFVLSHLSRFRISLLRMMEEPSLVQEPVLRKLVLKPQARLELLRELKRMNITGASLFPGLDGFSRGLRINLELEVDAAKRSIEGR
ncbi:MAG: FRG domain-containing protein [Bryobacteraceae bacterium]|nr:FRG domain-containing protein [Bryobacteraceae bacterium]